MKRSKSQNEGKDSAEAAPPGPPAPIAAVPEDIFLDRRTGRDRRDFLGASADSRRERSDRRLGIGAVGRAALAGGAWWLQRGYVDSHHFVENSNTLNPVPLPGARA